MTAKERIRKLEDLLTRVQTRALEARGAYPDSESISVVMSVAAPVAVEEPEPESLPPDTAHGDHLYAGGAEGAEEEDAEVEVSSEVVEVDIDIDEPVSGEAGLAAMESGAQPVALPTMPPEELEEVEEEASPRATQPSIPPAEEAIAAAPPANEIEEEAPSSSRRPIAGEEPAEETYSEESSPRHTPPPESGKQVTAPSVHPAARGSEPSFGRADGTASLNPSAPPPSLEGHTLVGGWREPGLGPQAAPGATTGVRVPGSPAAPFGSTTSPVIPAATSGTRLAPEVTRPDLTATGNVARIEGAAPTPRPTTMGELLDLTLSL